MQEKIITLISKKLQLPAHKVQAVLELFESKCTVPFIARYRKEKTGNLDEVEIIAIRDESERLTTLTERVESILEILKEREKLTPELKKALLAAETLQRVEDIYRPYKQKRKTKASVAREKGLEPLAQSILKNSFSLDIDSYIDGNIVKTKEEALGGAVDIASEEIAQNSRIREGIRNYFKSSALVTSTVNKKKKEEARKYADYFDYSESIRKIPSHRIHAILRGSDEGFLNIHFRPDSERALILIKRSLELPSKIAPYLEESIKEAYKRFIETSTETEVKNLLKESADIKAVEVFSSNLKKLLMEPGLGGKSLMAFDPGLRTGTKVAILNTNGDFKESFVVYPLAPHFKEKESQELIEKRLKAHDIHFAAVGNGTGGREMVDFLQKEFPALTVVSVNESGASVYSASDAARKEFPDMDLTVRGAISIGRRLMDPLNELVKIDPMAIGVGQYQHDVNQKLLKKTLDDVVISCVNTVGVDVNLASSFILRYVSGLTSRTAEALVKYRQTKGPFKERKELLKVSGIGESAFLQAAGFIRIKEGKNPLDSTGIHPEKYPVVEDICKKISCPVSSLIGDSQKVDTINSQDFIDEETGLLTLNDILDELKHPGKDPREDFKLIEFDRNVRSMEDLHEGMILNGVVTNVTAFGAFVDMGVHQDGLVHISNLSKGFVSDPLSVVSVNDRVVVKVISVDIGRKRIALSMNDVDIIAQ